MMAMVAKRPPPPKVRVKVRTKTKEKQEEAKGKEEKEKEKKKKEQKKKKKKKKQQVLYNALFANAGGARRIAFAIDLSGSMDADGFGGLSRIDVVKKHLSQAIQSMQGVKHAAFGIATFTGTAQAPLGTALIPATPGGVAMGLNCVETMAAGGGNGGEPACLNLCLGMAPQAIFFLGDGGWDGPALIQTAQGCSATIHSIAFFTSGGGLKEIAANSGGTYREIHSEGDLHTAAAPSAASLPNAYDSSSGSDDGDSGSEDDDDADDDDDGDDEDGKMV
jgi:hypothetical protein